MSAGFPIIGPPGAQPPVRANFWRVFEGTWSYLAVPGGVYIDGTKSRDPGNSPYIGSLRPGLLMGKITSGGAFAPSILGVTTGASLSTATTRTVSALQAVEIARRIGTSGTLTVTGAPTANGTVRQLTLTYSAIDTSTGIITGTALGVNEVQTLTFGAAATGGTMRLLVPLADGTLATTDAITWNGTDATWLANIQSALDTATGVVNGIVVTGAAPDTVLTFTFSGTGYAGNTWTRIQVNTFPTSTTTANVVRTTTGVAGAMVAGSFIGPTDGSQNPLSFIGQQAPVVVLDENGNSNAQIQWPQVPDGGVIATPASGPNCGLINWPTDTSLQNWIRTSLSTLPGGKFIWSDQYGV